MGGAQRVSAGDEEGDVVRPRGQELLEDAVAGRLERRSGLGQDAQKRPQSGVDVVVAGFDQSVGVQNEQAA